MTKASSGPFVHALVMTPDPDRASKPYRDYLA